MFPPIRPYDSAPGAAPSPAIRPGKGWAGSALLRRIAAAVLLCLAVSGCGGGLSDGAGVAACNAIGPSGVGFFGRALYEDRLYDKSGFISRQFKPVRYAKVELRVGTDVFGTNTTDANGNFCVTTPAIRSTGEITVRLKAVAQPPGTGGNTVTVTDSSGEVYFLGTGGLRSRVRLGELAPLDPFVVYEADSQTANDRLLSHNQGGAFSILDTATGGFEFAKSTWGRVLPNLQVSWQFVGGISGTYFLHRDPSVVDPNTCDPNDPTITRCTDRINIKGQSGEDSDEYDDDIVLHEFGHFALWNLSEDDSPGGTHYINGANQDARLAWSEGWANFFSTMVRDVHPGGFSNVDGERALIVDAFSLTSGTQRALRFAYNLTTPQAYQADNQGPVASSVAVDDRLFRQLTKQGTSEVSVAVALWDVYAGGVTTDPFTNAVTGSWRGIGADGILRVIEHMPSLQPVNGWEPMTFTDFWKAYSELYPDHAAEIRDHFRDERLLTIIDDEWGADDTVAEFATVADNTHHYAKNIGVGRGVLISEHTLFPEGDVDLFQIQVDPTQNNVPVTVEITTTHLSDGADTYLEVLQEDGVTPATFADGSPAVNDNYIYWVQRYVDTLDDGTKVPHEWSWIDYNGRCGRERKILGNAVQLYVNSCPDNAAYPAPHPALAIPEYLASQVTVDLTPGVYYVRVSRSPGAPPSAGKHGGYALRVTGL